MTWKAPLIFQAVTARFPDAVQGDVTRWHVEENRVRMDFSEKDGLHVTWDGRGRILDLTPGTIGGALTTYELFVRTKDLLEKNEVELVGFSEREPVLRHGDDNWLVLDVGPETPPSMTRFEGTPQMAEGADPRKVWEKLGLVFWLDWDKLGLKLDATRMQEIERSQPDGTEINDLVSGFSV